MQTNEFADAWNDGEENPQPLEHAVEKAKAEARQQQNDEFARAYDQLDREDDTGDEEDNSDDDEAQDAKADIKADEKKGS